MERGREKAAEGLSVLSVTAVLGICILHIGWSSCFLCMRCKTGWEEGGRGRSEHEREGESKLIFWKQGCTSHYMVQTTACAEEPALSLPFT